MGFWKNVQTALENGEVCKPCADSGLLECTHVVCPKCRTALVKDESYTCTECLMSAAEKKEER